MYPDRSPLRTNLDGGTLGEHRLLSENVAVKGGFNQDQRTSSENCDPNLRNAREGCQKYEPSFGVKEACINSQNAAQLPSSQSEGGLVNEVTCTSPKHTRELTVRNGSAKSSPPTNVSSSPDQHHHGHGHRHHCRSPRCASNNPDYAVPAQTTPRKYLISKRHLVPGAICTRDPSAVVKLTQDSPSVTSRPPKSIRKIENSFGESSHLPSNGSPAKDALPPTRIPKPPSSKSPRPQDCPGQHSGFQPAKVSGAMVFKHPPPTLLGLTEPCDQGRKFEDTGVSTDEAFPPVHYNILRGDNAGDSNLLRVESDLSCSVLVASTSSQVSDVGEIVQPSDGTDQIENMVSTGADVEPELSTLEKLYLPAFVGSDLSDEPRPGAGEWSNSLGSPAKTEAEVEYVAERLAHDLAFEDKKCADTLVEECRTEIGDDRTEIENTAVQEAECESVDVVCSANDLTVSRFDDSLPCVVGCNAQNELLPPESQSAEREGSGSSRNSLGTSGEESTLEVLTEQKFTESSMDKNSGILRDGLEGSNAAQPLEAKDGESFEPQYTFQRSLGEDADDSRGSLDLSQEDDAEKVSGRSITGVIANFESFQRQSSQIHHRKPKFVRGQGGQLWQSDCRYSREVVFLKPTSPPSRKNEEWTVDSVLEGAISKLNPSGEGRVRVLVEAFESLSALGGTDLPEKRASRVWCLNSMKQGEVDEDGEEFQEGDQRVDCYEVSQEGLQLRASMRLSLGGGNRLPLYDDEETNEIEMSAIQKVEEWVDDCGQQTSDVNSIEDPSDASNEFRSSPGSASMMNRDGLGDDQSVATEMYRIHNLQDARPSVHFSESCADGLSEIDRCSEDRSAHVYWKDRNQESDSEQIFKGPRRRRIWRATSVKSYSAISPPKCPGNALKERRPLRGTLLEPFRLITEERGAIKEDQFARKLEYMFIEEERQRIPIAQGLPWTTDEPEFVPKPLPKDQTRPVEFRHYSNFRAVERADFDDYLARRSEYAEMQRQEKERLRQLAEEEEIKKLRREMVPRAQLMPFFNHPFIPSRSSKRLTIPKEPAFHNRETKRAKCVVWQDRQQQP